MDYEQVIDTGNETYRDDWVADTLKSLLPSEDPLTLLDVGAGSSPYRSVSEGLGYIYTSHDFNAYVPSRNSPGLQDSAWDYSPHAFVCDILDLPGEAASDVVLCTEVLEHVPDPVRSFQRMADLVKPSGYLVVTVPFLSLMHQAPYWFQAGLSPYWFQHWGPSTGLETQQLIAQGDYVDLMRQEISRTMTFRPRIKGLPRVASAAVRRLRSRLPETVLQSGALGTLYVGRKQR